MKTEEERLEEAVKALVALFANEEPEFVEAAIDKAVSIMLRQEMKAISNLLESDMTLKCRTKLP